MSDRFLEQRVSIKFCVKLSLEMKSGVFSVIPESKRQNLQWKQPTSPQHKKALMWKSQIKTLLITVFHIKGIVHVECIP
jgi:hypothetical protein